MAKTGAIRAGRAFVELFADDSKMVRGLKRAQAKLKAFGTSVRHAGMQLAKLSAAFATPLVIGVKIFADFEQQMANVATMLDEPGKHMMRFRKGVRDMSVEFGESTETLAKGLYDILSASVPAEHALSVLSAAAKAAQAGITDTGIAADAITTILNAYGLSAERAGDVSDWLFSIVKRGKTTFAELAPNIGRVATIAASAGVGLDEMGAALATMTRVGVQTDQAITGLRAIIATVLKPTDEAAEYAKTLGFELSSATIQTEGLVGVFKKISKLPPDAISNLFPNIRALAGIVPALKNMKGFTEDISIMADRAGRTEVAYKKMTGTLAHSFRQIKQSAIATLSVVGEALAESVARIARTIKTYTGYVRQILEKNKALIVSAAKVVTVMGLVSGALIVVGVAGAILSFVLGGILSIFAGVKVIIGALLSPIALVSAAFAALAGYLVYASGAGGKALHWLGERFADLKTAASIAIGAIGKALMAGDIKLAAKVFWLGLKLAWQKGLGSLRIVWSDFWAEIRKGHETAVHHCTKAMLDMATLWEQSVTKIGSFLKDLATTTKAYAREANVYLLDLTEEQRAAEIEAIWLEAGEQLGATEKTKNAALKAIDEQHAATMKLLDQQHKKELAGIEAASKLRQAKTQEEIDAARKEYEEALAKVAAIPTMDFPEAPDRMKGFQEWLAKFQDTIDNLDGVMAKATIGVKGTFQASMVERLGAVAPAASMQRIAQETAENTKATAENTKRLERNSKAWVAFG